MPHSLRAKLSGLRYKGIIEDKDYKRLCHALDLEKAEQQPCDDAISRQVVMDALCDECELFHKNGEQTCLTKCESYHFLSTLPSVTLKPIECDDAIRRDAAKKWICNTCPDDSECQRDCDVIKGIDALPPVTPQQKYGKWINGDCEGGTCSICEKYYAFYPESGDFNYCPSCGAKMQESEE